MPGPILVTQTILERTDLGALQAKWIDQGGSEHDARAYGAVLDGTTDDEEALSNAIETAQTSGIKLLTLRGGTARIGSALTVPAGMSLRILEGAKLKPDNGVTLTINGAFEAGLYQVFDTSGGGSVVFGSGAVERVFPQWWGAVGDGVADDTAAIEAACAAVNAAGGGSVFLPSGTYLVGSPPLEPVLSNVVLEGAGYDSVLKVATDATGNHCVSLSSSSTNWKIRNLRLEGPQSGDIATLGLSIGIKVDGLDRTATVNFDSAIEGCVIRNFPNHAIRITEGASQVAVRGCTIFNCAAGIGVSHGAKDVELVGNGIRHIWSHGIFVDDATTGDTPVTAEACERAIIAHNRIRDCGYDPLLNTYAGVSITGCLDLTVAQNTIEGISGNGIAIGVDNGEIVPRGITVAGNVIHNTALASVLIVGQDMAVVGNVCVDPNTAAGSTRFIEVQARPASPTVTTKGVVVAGNVLIANTSTVDHGVVFDGKSVSGGGAIENFAWLNRVVGHTGSQVTEVNGATSNTVDADFPQLALANIWTANQQFGNGTGAVLQILNGAAGTTRYLQYETAGSTRWQVGADSSAEGGANAGSDYVIVRRADDESNLGVALKLSRLTGRMTAAINAGTTASRPSSPASFEMYFDTTLGKPIWFNGTNWVDATGATV